MPPKWFGIFLVARKRPVSSNMTCKRYMLYIITACLLCNCSISIVAEPLDRIGVLDFTAIGSVTAEEARIAREIVIQKIVRSKRYVVIDRADLDAVLKEQAFQSSGCTDSECAVRIGRLLAANKLMTAEMTKISGKYYMDGRIVDVETGTVEHAERSSKPEDNMESCATSFAGRILSLNSYSELWNDNKYIWMSIIYPGLGQFYSGHQSRGIIFLIGFTASLANFISVNEIAQGNPDNRRAQTHWTQAQLGCIFLYIINVLDIKIITDSAAKVGLYYVPQENQVQYSGYKQPSVNGIYYIGFNINF